MKRYLGDGVYAELVEAAIVLTTENGLQETNRIVLDDQVWANLVRYVDHLHTVTAAVDGASER